MCDEKQSFPDGSFLHTTFITVFYALALWEAYAHWPLAARPTGDVYDIAFWSSPVRSTPERGRRLELQIANHHLREESTRIGRRLRDLKRRTVAAFSALIVFSAGSAIAFASSTVKATFVVEEPGTFWSYVSVAAAFGVLLVGAIIKLYDRDDDDVD